MERYLLLAAFVCIMIAAAKLIRLCARQSSSISCSGKMVMYEACGHADAEKYRLCIRRGLFSERRVASQPGGKGLCSHCQLAREMSTVARCGLCQNLIFKGERVALHPLSELPTGIRGKPEQVEGANGLVCCIACTRPGVSVPGLWDGLRWRGQS